ncbi:hypothetical protein PFISCL1PPCAC_24706, partial [Pristionchus fissidentatus]
TAKTVIESFQEMINFFKRFLSYFYNTQENILGEMLTTKEPVCVRRAFNGMIYDELMERYPKLFTTIMPYTSRAPLEYELDGGYFHFVSEERIRADERNNEYIELITSYGKLYGLTIGGVQDVLRQGKHCILDVIYDNAIRRLKSLNINPIVILVKPSSHDQIINWADGNIREEDAHKEFRRCCRDEQNFGDLITHVITDANSFEDIFQQVKDIVFGQKRQLPDGPAVFKECAVWMEPEQQQNNVESINSYLDCSHNEPLLIEPLEDDLHSSWIR